MNKNIKNFLFNKLKFIKRKKELKKVSFKDILVVTWFIIQLTFISFGGGNAVLPSVHNWAVKKYNWLNEKEFDQIVITSNMIPGPSVIETLSYIAIKRLGWHGVYVTFLAILPHVFMAIGIYYGFSKLPSKYLLVVNVATLSVIIGMLIGFVIRYLKNSRQEGIRIVPLFALIAFTFGFSFFVPVPFNIPAIVMIGLMITIFIIIAVKKHRIKIALKKNRVGASKTS